MTSAPPSGRKRKIYYDRQQQRHASLSLCHFSVTSADLALLGLARRGGLGHRRITANKVAQLQTCFIYCYLSFLAPSLFSNSKAFIMKQHQRKHCIFTPETAERAHNKTAKHSKCLKVQTGQEKQKRFS